MKNITTFWILFSIVFSCSAQLTLEHTYEGYDRLKRNSFKNLGVKYEAINLDNNTLTLFNEDFSVYKEVLLTIPTGMGPVNDITSIPNYLSKDGRIPIIFTVQGPSGFKTIIADDSGENLLLVSGHFNIRFDSTNVNKPVIFVQNYTSGSLGYDIYSWPDLTLEASYSGALRKWKLPDNSFVYSSINNGGTPQSKTVKLFDEDHELLKSIDLLINQNNFFIQENTVQFIGKNAFNTNNKFIIGYAYQNTSTNERRTTFIDEDGVNIDDVPFDSFWKSSTTNNEKYIARNSGALNGAEVYNYPSMNTAAWYPNAFTVVYSELGDSGDSYIAFNIVNNQFEFGIYNSKHVLLYDIKPQQKSGADLDLASAVITEVIANSNSEVEAIVQQTEYTNGVEKYSTLIYDQDWNEVQSLENRSEFLLSRIKKHPTVLIVKNNSSTNKTIEVYSYPTSQDPVLSSTSVATKNVNSIFPNPASQEIFVNFNNTTKGELIIYNLNGQVVEQSMFFNNQAINVSYLENGIYVIEVNTANESYREKLIKL